MRATLALCLLAASTLAVANAAPSVGGADLQDKELRDLLKRLQTDLEALEKKSDEGVEPAGGDVSQQVGGEGSGSGQPAGGEGSQQSGGEGSGSGQPAGGDGGQPTGEEGSGSGQPAGGDGGQQTGGEGSGSGQPAGGDGGQQTGEEGSGSGQPAGGDGGQQTGGEGSGSGQPAGGDEGQQTGEEGSGSGQPAPEVPSEERPDGTNETNVGQPDIRAMTYLLDLSEKTNALGNALIRLWQSYGGAVEGPSAPERRRRAAGDENRPQQVIVRREILNILTEMEYDLVALELLPRESPGGEKKARRIVLPDSPVVSSAKAVGGKSATDVRSTEKESRTGDKPVDERAALMQQLRKFLAKRVA